MNAPTGADDDPITADALYPRNFDYHDLDREEGCFVVRAGHPLADRGTVSLRDLADLQWVLEPRGSIIRHSVEALFREQGIAPPRRVINSSSHIVSLAIAAEIDADDMQKLCLGDDGAMIEETRVDRLRSERMEGTADFRRVVVAHRA